MAQLATLTHAAQEIDVSNYDVNTLYRTPSQCACVHNSYSHVVVYLNRL